jgi:signal transduction histidine kinase
MAIEPELAPEPQQSTPISGEALAALALGLRFIALAVVAGSGALLLQAATPRASLAAGILASALLGLAQSALARRRPALPGEMLVLAQVAVWIYLLHTSGGQRSPLFIGLVLEVPLAGSLLGRRGCVLAAASGAGAYLAYAMLLPLPLERDAIALVTGFIAVAGVLTWILLGILDRQRAALAAARAALASRAENLATELRLLGDYLGGALLSVDDMGRVASVNEAGSALLGLEAQGAVGRPWQEVLRPDPATAEHLVRTLAQGEAQRDVPVLFRRGDGVPVALRGDLWVSPSQNGRRMHLLLDRPAGTGAIDDPVHRLGEAAACVAHQIKNSLHALRGLAHVAERDASRPDAALDARRFLGALRSLSELTDDVLAVAGTARPPAEEVPLAQAIASAMLLARPGAVHVTVDPAAEELRVWAPRGRLVHAIYNLIDNACRATPPGGAVRVCMRRMDGCACVDIVDGGPGLPPGVDGSGGPVPSQQGSGLGLMAARRFLEGGGGNLSFAAAPDGGTLCRILWPVGSARTAGVPELERA